MFGFLFGTACLVGLAMILRRRRYRRCGAYGRDRYYGHGGWGRGGGGGWGRGRWSWHGFLASRLEATPEQEKVIRDEMEGFLEKTQELRRELRLSRDDIAKAMRTDAFDEEIMGESFARQDDRIREIREALVGALARIHDSLDERQRQRLAGLIESLDRAGGWR